MLLVVKAMHIEAKIETAEAIGQLCIIGNEQVLCDWTTYGTVDLYHYLEEYTTRENEKQWVISPGEFL